MTPTPDMVAEMLTGAHYIGSSVLLAQGAGGNNSVKDPSSDTLWVKASGIRLSQNSGVGEFIGLRLRDIVGTLRNPAFRAISKHDAQELSVERFVAAVHSGAPLRPSLETGMHASLPQRVVLHTHSVYINAFSCMLRGQQEAEHVLPSHKWLAYATPGFDLALAVEELVASGEANKERLAVVLGNHGFVAASSSSNEAIAISQECLAATQHFFGEIDPAWLAQEPPTEDLQELTESICTLAARKATHPWSFRAGRFGMFRFRSDLLAGPALRPFVPDDVVYLGRRIWRVASVDKAYALIDRLLDRCTRFSVVVSARGVFFAGDNESVLDAMEESMLAHMLIALLISRRGTVLPMAAGNVSEIAAMESEKYRLGMTGGAIPEGRCRL